MTTRNSTGSLGAPLFDLRGKVAFITGAAGLLGAVHARGLAASGADLVLSDLHLNACAELAGSIEHEYGVQAIACRCDVTSEASWDEALGRGGKVFPRVDILVNNAGFTNTSRSVGYDMPFEQFTLEDWNAVLEVNLTGTFLGCRAVGKRMLAQGSGSIINMASLYGVVSPHHPMYDGTGVVQPAAYSVSKAGVLGLTRYLAALWAGRGVRVNALTPGGVLGGQSESFVERFNELNPTGRMARPEEIAGAVLFLASDASSYCTGHNLVVDGGWTVW